jgi:glycosyltransferase involved in cell wall biosynthesis
MRILFTRFPLESALGGAEIQTLSLMEGLVKRGHAVAFLGSCPTLLKECRARQWPVAELHIGPPPVTKWRAVSFAWRRGSMAKKLRRALGEFQNLDAVVMLSMSEKLLATDWLAKNGTKVLWVEHDRIGPWLTRNPWLPMLRTQSKSATTVCVSHLSREMYLQLGWEDRKTVAIANGIDVGRFGEGEKKTEATGALRLGCVARLSKEKGIDVLINAVATMPDVQLEIVGTGPEESVLQDQITRLELGNRVHMIGKIEDLAAFYASKDAIVLPSREHDPFGLVAAEAMALGVPAVVTDSCGIAGELQDSEAIIVKADDAAALAQGIELLRDPAERQKFAENGRKAIRERFTAENMTERYAALLSS